MWTADRWKVFSIFSYGQFALILRIPHSAPSGENVSAPQSSSNKT